MSTWCSAAILRTTGDERVRRSSSAVISDRGFSGARRRTAPRRGRGSAGGALALDLGTRPAAAPGRGGAARGGAAAARRPCGERAPRASGGAGRRPAGWRGAAAVAASPSAAITPTTVLIGDRRARRDADLLEDARGRRRDLGVHLVGRDLEQRLVALDAVADVLQPLRDRALGDRLAHLRHDDVGHGSPRSLARA